MDALQRSVGAQIDHRGGQGKRCRQQIGGKRQIRRAAQHHHQSGRQSLREAHVPSDQGRSRVRRIKLSRSRSITSFSAAVPPETQANAEQRVQQRPGQRRDTGLSCAEIIATPGGHHDQRGNPELDQLRVVAQHHRDGDAGHGQAGTHTAHAETAFCVPGETRSGCRTGTCRHA